MIKTFSYKIVLGDPSVFKTKSINGFLERIIIIPDSPVHVIVDLEDGSRERLLEYHAKGPCSCTVRIAPVDPTGKAYGVVGEKPALDSPVSILASGKAGSVLLVKFLVSQ